MAHSIVPLLGLLAGLGLATQPGSVTVTQSSSTTEKFAFLEHGRGPEVPLALVRDADRTFTQLETRCTQNRDGQAGQPGLSDMAVKAVQELRKKGRPVGYLEFLRGMATATKALKTRSDCVQIAAAMWAMLDK